jgi:hypothetical protein
MANTYNLIEAKTLSATAASITFSSIPATYTDLVLKWSSRDTETNVDRRITIRLNGDSSSIYSNTTLYGTGSGVGPDQNPNVTAFFIDGGSTASGATANTFSNGEFYIPQYTSTTSKPMSIFTTPETNATAVFMAVYALLYRNSSAINSISFTPSLNFDIGSTFYLYGISNA